MLIYPSGKNNPLDVYPFQGLFRSGKSLGIINELPFLLLTLLYCSI